MSSTPNIWKISGVSPAATESRTSLERRARRFFALNAVLGSAALVAVAVAVGGGAHSIHVLPTSRVGRFSVFGLHFTHPYVNGAAAVLLVLAALGVAVLAKGLAALGVEALASRRFLRAMTESAWPEREDVLAFEDLEVRAFCAGLIRPRIYVSTGALNALSEAELDAVLAHERHHRLQRDPLRIAVGRVLARALFFLPVVGLLHRRYCALAELTADDRAVAAQPQGAKALASALLAFSAAQQSPAAVGIAPERVERMLGRPPSWPLPTAVVLAGLGAMALLVTAALRLAEAGAVKASFSLPFFSSQPCVVVLALIPSAVAALALVRLRRFA